MKKIRLEIAVNGEYVQSTIGDGKIFVMPLERCVRIRTGDEGKEAIG